jgi:hypothetical protein
MALRILICHQNDRVLRSRMQAPEVMPAKTTLDVEIVTGSVKTEKNLGGTHTDREKVKSLNILQFVEDIEDGKGALLQTESGTEIIENGIRVVPETEDGRGILTGDIALVPVLQESTETKSLGITTGHRNGGLPLLYWIEKDPIDLTIVHALPH